jgi:hypothetical protein
MPMYQSKPTPLPSVANAKVTAPAHLGAGEQALYLDIVRNYGLAGNQVALRILTEALTSLTIAGECHDQIKTQGRIVWDGRGPNGEGIASSGSTRCAWSNGTRAAHFWSA